MRPLRHGQERVHGCGSPFPHLLIGESLPSIRRHRGTEGPSIRLNTFRGSSASRRRAAVAAPRKRKGRSDRIIGQWRKQNKNPGSRASSVSRRLACHRKTPHRPSPVPCHDAQDHEAARLELKCSVPPRGPCVPRAVPPRQRGGIQPRTCGSAWRLRPSMGNDHSPSSDRHPIRRLLPGRRTR